MARNTYQCIANGISFGNGVNSTRVRSIALAGIQTLQGSSLTLNTNTELRIKGVGSTVNFPGVDVNPGLILNGGMLNAGDDGTFPVTGSRRVNALSYISLANAGGGGGLTGNDRAVNISVILSSSGDLAFLNCRTSAVNRFPTR